MDDLKPKRQAPFIWIPGEGRITGEPEDLVSEEMRKAAKRVLERRRSDPAHRFEKQIDGEIKPTLDIKAFRSPEHYHISYECDGRTYPYTQVSFRRARMAYLEMWRIQSMAALYGEPEFDEGEGTITIYTPIRGRTGRFKIVMRPVECFLLGCGEQKSPVELALNTASGQSYDIEIGPSVKKVEG